MAFLLVWFAGIRLLEVNDYLDESAFGHLSPAEHLRIAKQSRTITGLARRHLKQIPASAPEYPEAVALLNSVEADEEAHQRALQKEQARFAFSEHQAQRKENRDADAQLHSYWPTTLRVDTDMDSFWLNNEERICQTFPDEKGRVAVVACNPTGSHRDHNIPVRFWGGIDRDVISGWKCRREGDDFVCRAIN